MKLKINFFTGFLLLFFNIISSQNTVLIGSAEMNTETVFDMAISLNNTDAVSAIQFDIIFNNNAIELTTGHQLTSRGVNHSLAVSTPTPGMIRVLIYSGSNASIQGSTGDLLILKLRSKTLPGNFVLNYSNVVVSSPTGSAVTTAVQPGSVKVLGPQMNIMTTEVDFGRVPIGATPTNTIIIQNLGNVDLVLTSANSVLPFSIQESFPVTVNANASKNLTVQINSSVKYNSSALLSFQNNDPDALRKLQNITLRANVYAVNEIKIGSGAGEINTEVEIPVVIENMEPFTGFQFDILLPAGIEYVPNSIVQSGRFDGHTIAVNLINGNTLRFLAYSGSNKNFIGNAGTVFSYKLKPNVSSGNYPLAISNALISNITLGNIVSDSFNGSIQINAPDLYINPASISYGNVPITETRQTTVRLTNTGSALLTIDALIYSAAELSWDMILPLDIEVGTFKDVNLTFAPNISGNFSETVSFRHNGAAVQNLFPVQATVFSPNYVMVASQEAYLNQINKFQILLKNNDPVRAVQFDVELPVGFDLNPANVTNTVRSNGFTVSASKLSGNFYRIILYTVSSTTLTNGIQSIIEMPVLIDNSVSAGVYQFNFSNVIISDVNSQNIGSVALENGEITLVNKINLMPKIFLQGPSLAPASVGLMNDNLRLSNLPATSPYADALTTDANVFNSGGISGTGESKDDIVDWIWVELRDALSKTTVVAGKSAFVQRDGDIVDIDGISQVSFEVANGNYFVAIKHRNHLGIMSATAVALASAPISLDFTVDSSLIYGGGNAVKNIGGTLTMISGDFDNNGQVQNTDITNIVLLLGGSGYSKADLDMNGQIQNTDINNIINPNIGKGEQF